MTIGEKIKTARKQKGLTQQKLAELIGVQASAISKYEKDLVDVPYSKLIAISQALEVDMSELLSLDKAETKTEDKPAQSVGNEAIQMNDEYTKKFKGLMLDVVSWTNWLKKEHGLSTDEALKTILIVAIIDDSDQSIRIWETLNDVRQEVSNIWSAIDTLPL